MSHVHQRLKDYDTAVNLLLQVWELQQAQFGQESIEVARAYIELAIVHIKKKDYNEAINFQ
jgi:lipopolysaccharide biosynthesis regulator YciM